MYVHMSTVSGQQSEKMVRFYCCCTSHIGAARILGIVWLVLHILWLVVMCHSLAKLDNDLFQYGFHQAAIGILATIVPVDVGFVYGSFKKSGFWLLIWTIAMTICSFFYVILTIIWITSALEILVGVASLLINIWAILTVRMAVKEIEEEKQNAVIIYVKYVAQE